MKKFEIPDIQIVDISGEDIMATSGSGTVLPPQEF